ncbi:MAG: response regulator [Kaiparowitsia implicata GSE-PSE-MK54-09C]|jgi:CheY-like chemotaxis protein|nr:response regulator [Kaiparowitsia implicata GSE-PSE-MK54-09C]
MSAKRILVIDDESIILEVIQACLDELTSWDVLTAVSGTAGVELAQTQQPDAILLDMSMPGLNGFQVMSLLRQHPATQTIPVLLLTARALPEDQALFAPLDVLGVIVKPFDPFSLIEQIGAYLGWQV